MLSKWGDPGVASIMGKRVRDYSNWFAIHPTSIDFRPALMGRRLIPTEILFSRPVPMWCRKLLPERAKAEVSLWQVPQSPSGTSFFLGKLVEGFAGFSEWRWWKSPIERSQEAEADMNWWKWVGLPSRDCFCSKTLLRKLWSLLNKSFIDLGLPRSPWENSLLAEGGRWRERGASEGARCSMQA